MLTRFNVGPTKADGRTGSDLILTVDDVEVRVNQNDADEVAKLATKFKDATPTKVTGTEGWWDWFVACAVDEEEVAEEAPPAGDNLPLGPREARLAALEAMTLLDVRAAAQASGLKGFSKVPGGKPALIGLLIAHEFPTAKVLVAEPVVVEPVVVEPEPAPPVGATIPSDPEPEAAPVAEKPAKAKKGTKAAVAVVTPTPAVAPTAPTVVADHDTRPELAGDIEGGDSGGLEGFGELGAGLGVGDNEVGGGLGSGVSAALGGTGRDGVGEVHRPGAGCKQPDEVKGWIAGRVLVAIRRHRGDNLDWGTCEYRVRCEEDGGYKLLALSGGRDDAIATEFKKKGFVKWDYVSDMFLDLLAIPRVDAEGQRNRHRMTLTRFFRSTGE